MSKFLHILLAVILVALPGSRGWAADKEKDTKKEDALPETTLVQWFGQAFVYITSQSGVRIAINPFDKDAVNYTIPSFLPAEIVLISAETSDHNGSQNIAGIPQVFRSSAGVGANRANGISFRGIRTYRDSEMEKGAGSNTVFVLEVDGMRFCHLGLLGQPLTSRQKEEIGRVDVLFLPVGPLALSPNEILRNAQGLNPKVVIPLNYQTEKTPRSSLRPRSEMVFGDWPTRTFPSVISLNADDLPAKTTVYDLAVP